MASAYDNVVANMAASGHAMPVRISEYMCYADFTAQARVGVDVADEASTAACLSGQTTAVMGRARWTSV